MAQEVYHVVQHDGGWAYKADGVYSETFATHEAAFEAAKIAAQRQRQGGESEGISWEDAKGRWHDEVASGSDRPDTQVVDGD